MVDNSGSSKAQMPSMSQESGLGGVYPQGGTAGGMKLEAVMEQLQRQQQARLEMERKERRLREAHIMYAQQVAAQQAILAAARASGAGFMGMALGGGGGGGAGIPRGGPLSRVFNQSSVDSEREDEDRGRDSGDEDDDEEMMDGDEGSEEEEGGASGLEYLRKQTLALQQGASRLPAHPFGSYSTSGPQQAPLPPVRVKQEPDESRSPAGPHSATSPNGQAEWNSFDDQFKQNGSAAWADENDSGRGGRGEASRDFAKLYELDSDPNRKEFLDDLFTYMQKRGTPVNRIPIMAKQVLDLYMLYKLVTEKGGLVEVINKKIWREITKGLSLPTSITSAAFTLRTQYMKYLYPFECERKGLSSPGELQAAIDSNRREGRRPSYSSSLFRFSPSTAPHILSPPKMHLSALGAAGSLNGLLASPVHSLKKEEITPSMMAAARGSSMSLALGQAEEQQRLMQQAFQHNLLAMASQVPMNLRLGSTATARVGYADVCCKTPTRKYEKQQDMALSISTNGSASISVSVEVNGTLYSGNLFAQKSGAPATSVSTVAPVPPAGPSAGFGFATSAHSHSPSSSSSSKGPCSAEPSTSGSP
ncbi:hypothetical protein J4Q44_G00354330 [Coregonus suidteri]|uniref:AT-rich interactive domain-containing protein 3 n=1 Tax=Coregonus suidteri TaxID=861788 RepID=A0AAN8QFH2_9TELE